MRGNSHVQFLGGGGGSNASPLPDQALETKARFISQVMEGQNTARRAEDIGGQELSYAEVKAIASGNPAVLTLAEADAELQRLTVLKKNHADEQYLTRRNLRDLPERIDRLTERHLHLTADHATLKAHADDPIAIGKRASSGEDALGILGERLDTLPAYVSEARRISLGVYRGLRFGIVRHPQYAPEVYLEGATTRQWTLSREHHGPRAVLNALERLAGGYGSECDRVREDLTIARDQQRDYQARLGQPFTHDAYLSGLTALRDQLKVGLSGATPEAGSEPQPGVAELAEQIKALRAARTIEATPERTGQRRTSAEEPVRGVARHRSGRQAGGRHRARRGIASPWITGAGQFRTRHADRNCVLRHGPDSGFVQHAGAGIPETRCRRPVAAGE
jgi:hypothetical protein